MGKGGGAVRDWPHTVQRCVSERGKVRDSPHSERCSGDVRSERETESSHTVKDVVTGYVRAFMPSNGTDSGI